MYVVLNVCVNVCVCVVVLLFDVLFSVVWCLNDVVDVRKMLIYVWCCVFVVYGVNVMGVYVVLSYGNVMGVLEDLCVGIVVCVCVCW